MYIILLVYINTARIQCIFIPQKIIVNYFFKILSLQKKNCLVELNFVDSSKSMLFIFWPDRMILSCNSITLCCSRHVFNELH